ncbi:hypothetical protein [Rhizobium leguminosarum]|uniref:hypothetical protein n=1 Tax=Rhizobium leguminosarum TaxID=384 RepID=UPI00102FE48F|nr:hypothetical protein [Rhizobium leguminosarum]TBG16003.1 hypothetical protein ELG80_09075 [Rhizobium leguminosarum]
MKAVQSSGPARQGSLHDSMLLDVVMPPCFIDCKATDNRWYANFGVETRSDPGPRIIDFAVPITPFPDLKLLTDAEFEHDLITVKRILIEGVRPQPHGWISSKEYLSQVFRTLLTFTRARVAVGIRRNSELSPAAKRRYVDRLRKGGLFNIIDFGHRTQTIMTAIDLGDLEVARNSRNEVDMKSIALLYGVHAIHSVPAEELDRLKAFLGSKNYRFRYDHRVSRSRRASVEKLRSDRAQELLKPWLWLHQVRDVLTHDPIPFRPYLNAKDIERDVKQWAGEKGSTKEVPPTQVVDLLSKSLLLLTDPLASYLVDLTKTMHPGFQLEPSQREYINSRLSGLGLGILSDSYAQTADLLEGISLRTLTFVFIPIAAASVIAMGTARRKDEIDSQQVGRVAEDAIGQLWLRVPIRKLRSRSFGKDANTAVIPISGTVKLAIDLIERLKDASGHKGSYLFDILDPVLGSKTGKVSLKLSKRLKEFSKWLRVPPLEDGSDFEFAAHQFRKFFAITYFYRYRFPSLPALSLHMMHLNLDVTRAYLATAARNSLQLRDEATAKSRRRTQPLDITRLEDFEGVGRGFVLDILTSAARGDLKLAGTAGLHLMRDLAKLTEQISATIDIHSSVDEDVSFNKLLKRFAAKKRIRPHPEGHGYCACGQSASCLIAANCLKLKADALEESIATFTDVDHAFADDLTCGTCVHHLLLPDLWPYWENEITQCQDALERASGEQKAMLKSRLNELHAYEQKTLWQWAA